MEGVLQALKMFLIIYLPPMAANGAPVVIHHYHKGSPIDSHKKWFDGKRILGDGKTWEGAIGGFVTGLITAIIIGTVSENPHPIIVTGALGSLGAILGDIVESFFKRRLGIERGEPLPIADQLDFYVGATIMIYLCGSCIKPGLPEYVTGLIIVPLLHYGTNYLAFKVGLKSVPW